MTWYEKHHGGWRARWKDGDQRPVGEVQPTREEAVAWAIANGHAEPPPTSIEDLIKRWHQVRLSERNVTADFLDTTRVEMIGLCAKRKWTRTADVTLSSIDDWRIDKKGKGIERPLSYLLSILRWGAQNMGVAVDAKVLAYKRARRPATDRDRQKLSDRDVERIVEHAGGLGPQVHALIHYLSVYGPRPVSACRLICRDVDIAHTSLRAHGKRSGKWRHKIGVLTVKLFSLILVDRRPGDPLFLDPRTDKAWRLTKKGAGVLASWYHRNFKKVAPKGLQNIYDLKRYAISRMLDKGIDPSTVAKFTGHLTLSQVLTYARTDTQMESKAIERIFA